MKKSVGDARVVYARPQITPDDSHIAAVYVRAQNIASVSERDDSWRLKKIEVLSSLALAVARCGEHKIAEDELLVAISEFQQLDGVNAIAGGGAHQVRRACLGNERVCCAPTPTAACALCRVEDVGVHACRPSLTSMRFCWIETRIGPCMCGFAVSVPTFRNEYRFSRVHYSSIAVVFSPSLSPPHSPLSPSLSPSFLSPLSTVMLVTYPPPRFAPSYDGILDSFERAKMQDVLVNLLKYLAVARRARGDIPGTREALDKVEAIGGSGSREHVLDLNRLLSTDKSSVD